MSSGRDARRALGTALAGEAGRRGRRGRGRSGARGGGARAGACPPPAAVAALLARRRAPLRLPGLGLLAALVLVGGAVAGAVRLAAIDAAGPLAAAGRGGARAGGPARRAAAVAVRLVGRAAARARAARGCSPGPGAVGPPRARIGDEVEVAGSSTPPRREGRVRLGRAPAAPRHLRELALSACGRPDVAGAGWRASSTGCAAAPSGRSTLLPADARRWCAGWSSARTSGSIRSCATTSATPASLTCSR